MKNTLFALILFISFALLGCEKPNPNPETLDPIYEDLQKELANAKNQVGSAEREVAEHQKSIDVAIPQTGQIKYAQKRFFEAEAKLTKAKQMVQYYELRIKSRLKWVKESYRKAYAAKEAWPNPAEFEEYKAQKALEQASRDWSVKARLEEAKAELQKTQNPKPAAGAH